MPASGRYRTASAIIGMAYAAKRSTDLSEVKKACDGTPCCSRTGLRPYKTTDEMPASSRNLTENVMNGMECGTKRSHDRFGLNKKKRRIRKKNDGRQTHDRCIKGISPTERTDVRPMREMTAVLDEVYSLMLGSSSPRPFFLSMAFKTKPSKRAATPKHASITNGAV